MRFDYDLLVIGGGPGGLAAAKRAAHYGARVAIAEQNSLGGTCVNRGCVPKKLMVYAADFALSYREAPGYGWTPPQSEFHWSKLVAAIQSEIQRLNQVYARSLQEAGVELIRGRASFVDAHTLQIADRQVTAEHILIAVGGKPAKLDIPGIELAIASKELFQLPQQPQRIAIIGGGYIGVEFASLLNALGSQVVLLDTHNRILAPFDQDLSLHVQAGLTQRGIRFFGNTTTKEIERTADGLQLSLTGDCPQTLSVDTVLCAVGRSANTENLGLEQAGIKTSEKGAIAVDTYSRTEEPHIFAVGDCTNRLALTPVAKAEGQAVAETIFGQNPQTIDYNLVPTAVFARPEAASIGMTEAQAHQQFGEAIDCDRQQFVPLFETLTPQKEKALIKLVSNRQSDQVLGIHMVGESAAEIVQAFAIALKKGITKQELDGMIGIHPSSAEEFFNF